MSKQTNRSAPIVTSSNDSLHTVKENDTVTAEQTAPIEQEQTAPAGQTEETAGQTEETAGQTEETAAPSIPQPDAATAPLWDALTAATARRDAATLDVLRASAQAEIDALAATPALQAYIAQRRDFTLQPARAALFASFIAYCDAAGLDATRTYSITKDAIAVAVTVAPTVSGKKPAGGNITKETPLNVGELGYRFTTARVEGHNTAIAVKGIVSRTSEKDYTARKVVRSAGTLTLAPVGSFTSASAANTALAKATGTLATDGKDIGLNQLWSLARADAPALDADTAADVAYLKTL